ncbi:MAG: glycosyltransferase [Clostridia bacterium]|nr:glycosyltransferase [Clostridia bacterium]
MKVLHVLASNIFSGAENVVCQIINLFDEDEMVYCSPKGKIEEQLKNKNINYIPLNKLSVCELKKAIKTFKPDIIHAHDVRACVVSAMTAKKIPIIAHIHFNDKKVMGKFSLKSFLFNFFSNKFKHVFWVSQSCFDCYKFKNKIKDKSTVLYNVISLDSLYKKLTKEENQKKYDVVYLGRLHPNKNPVRLVEIMSKLCKQNKKATMALIGDGQLREVVEQKIKDLKLENNISMLGYQENPYNIVNNSKVMLMTSICEGTPMCALESLALGVPIVSTETDGLVDLLNKKGTGYLYKEDDEAVKFISDIINNKVDLTKNCNDFAQKHNNLKVYKQKIKQVYSDVLTAKF